MELQNPWGIGNVAYLRFTGLGDTLALVVDSEP
jgi:hypothetical protein